MTRIIALLAIFAIASPAFGQSISPGTPAAGATLGANTFTGEQTLPASTTATAPLNIPHGVAPTSPVNGDIWTSTAGMYAQINGGTVGPFGAAGSGCTVSGTINQMISNNGSSGCQSSTATLTSGGLGTFLNLDFLGTTGACTASTNGIHLTAANTMAFCVNGASVGTVTSTGLNALPIGQATPATGTFGFLRTNASLQSATAHVLISITLPTVSSGFGTGPSVTASSTLGFFVTVGATGTPATTLVLTMPTATNGWACSGADQTNTAKTILQSGNSTTSVTFTASAAPANSDVLIFTCAGV